MSTSIGPVALRKKLKELENREEFEKSLRERHAKATCVVRGKLVMKKGRILDKKWWQEKVEKAWRDRRKYTGIDYA